MSILALEKCCCAVLRFCSISYWCDCLLSVPEPLHTFCPILKGTKNRKHSPCDSSSEKRTCFPTHYVSARKVSEIACTVLAVAYPFSGLALFPMYKT